MDYLEQLHRQELVGPRGGQIEQEQTQQELENSDDPDDFLSDSVLPQSIAEPAIELEVTENELSQALRDIQGEDEISLSLLSNQFEEISGTNDGYPSNDEENSIDFLQTDEL